MTLILDFSSTTKLSGATVPSVAVGDLDQDSHLDFAMVDLGSSIPNSGNAVDVFWGDGNGGSTAISGLFVPSPNFVAIGDLNNDGKMDLAVSSSSHDGTDGTHGTVWVLLANGNRTFGFPTHYATGLSPTSVAIGDVNGDGKLDLAVANPVDNTVSVLLGIGDGTFKDKTDYNAGPTPVSVAIGDLNNDGKLDLAVADNDGRFGSAVSVLLGNGDGTLKSPQFNTTGSQAFSVAIGDLNNDGKLDLAVANAGSNTVSVLLGNGDGSFRTQTPYATGSAPRSVAIGDLNNDGKMDLAVANIVDNTVSVLLGNGDGSFRTQTAYATTGVGPVSVAIGDMNEDGKPDLVVANLGNFSDVSGNVSFLLNVGVENRPPAITSNGGEAISVSIDENVTAVTTITATDPDAGQSQTLKYSIVDGVGDAGMFKLVGGQLSFITAPNFENNTDAGKAYNVTVKVSDIDGGTDTQAIAVTVKDVNEAPTITSNGSGPTASVSIDENTTAVTTVTATDPDVGQSQTLQYSIVDGVGDAGMFKLVGGQLSFITAPNFENNTDADENNVYDVMVQVSDAFGVTDTQAIAVTVKDVNEAPTITSNGSGPTASVSIDENTTAVTTVTATDPDAGQQVLLTYSIIGGADKGQFTINDHTGVLTFNTEPDFEHPTGVGPNNVYDVTVQVSDGHTGIDTQRIAVTVTDVVENSPPLITSDLGKDTAAVSVAENSTAVTTVTATDPEGQALTYSIIGGADASLFSIDINKGALAFKTAPDFENPTDAGPAFGDNVYNITVQVSDGHTGIDTQAIAVKVTDVVAVTTVGGNGGQTVTGTSEPEAITGGNGRDVLKGGGGNDTLSGGNGDDVLNGGDGNDRMDGGNGNDVFIFAAGFGKDEIRGFDANPSGGQDFLDISAFKITSNTFADHVTITPQVNGTLGTLVTIDGNAQTILLVGIAATTVTQADFLL